MVNLDYIRTTVSFLSDTITIVSGAIALYLLATKGKEIGSLYRAIVNYSYQITLQDLFRKLDELNSLNVEGDDKGKVVNIFSEVLGQIEGNRILNKQFTRITTRLRRHIKNKDKIAETDKRTIVCELRERLLRVQIDLHYPEEADK